MKLSGKNVGVLLTSFKFSSSF